MKVRELIEELSHADPEMDVMAAAMITVPDGGTLNVDEGSLTKPDKPKMFTVPNVMKMFEISTVSQGGKPGETSVIIGFEVPIPDVLDDELIH